MTCSITSTPTTTSSSAEMVVGVTQTSYIPDGTILTITMDIYWPTNALDTDPILDEPVNCLAITNTSNTIQCTYVRTSSSIVVTA